MAEKTSFARVAQAVLAVDELQQQMAELSTLVNGMAKRIEALETAAARRE